MKKLGFLVLIGWVLAQNAVAQVVGNSEKLFRDAVLEKQLYLRGFSADPIVHLHWRGSGLEGDTPQTRTVGVLVAHKVMVKRESITIFASRYTVLRGGSSGFLLAAADTPVEVDVDLHGADLATVLPGLADRIFYADQAEALADIPKTYRTALPGDADTFSKRPARPVCDCDARGTEACQDKQPTGGAEPPRSLSMVNPAFTFKARAAHHSGISRLALTVTDEGKPDDIWIAYPTGYGLDAQAVKAARRYTFAPSTCHGKPVNVLLKIEVNFQLH
jgi:TonB family protein